MGNWDSYTTGQRVKLLRGTDFTQETLAEAAGVSVGTIRKIEQGGSVSLPTLLRVSEALHTDVSVLVGQQAPRRAMAAADRAALRGLSAAVHDTAAGIGIDAAPPEESVHAAKLAAAWELYQLGDYTGAALAVSPLVQQAAAMVKAMLADRVCAARGVLSDSYRLAAYCANLMGARDLAYAAVGHAQTQAELASDPLRVALVASGRSWVYLRDSRLVQAQEVAEQAANAIEPRYTDSDPKRLAVYGCHIVFASVVASRRGDSDRAGDLLSHAHAVGARMGNDITTNGVSFGPVYATAQAVGINVALGQAGKALTLGKSLGDRSALQQATQNRLALDLSMAQCEARMWDTALDTLMSVCTEHPEWARHQALTVILGRRIGKANKGALRKLGGVLGADLLAG
ncbi:helix-turn-helix transcriptional regulator [Streptomyces tirandamycinicus]|uniref:XRE family transcriptional regulator n=1 Tax=Streptomyces spongiicola TaxID=1690221 RepID=A0ABM6V7W0_9ACTN|nr:helix-turn-helix transcriptional regulator [Streptomyces spongiicola]AWK10016.1 XRE family transcriptional regulator [Streptomyces spongiicola]